MAYFRVADSFKVFQELIFSNSIVFLVAPVSAIWSYSIKFAVITSSLYHKEDREEREKNNT